MVSSDNVVNLIATAKRFLAIMSRHNSQGHLFDKVDIHLFTARKLNQFRHFMVVAAHYAHNKMYIK